MYETKIGALNVQKYLEKKVMKKMVDVNMKKKWRNRK